MDKCSIPANELIEPPQAGYDTVTCETGVTEQKSAAKSRSYKSMDYRSTGSVSPGFLEPPSPAPKTQVAFTPKPPT